MRVRTLRQRAPSHVKNQEDLRKKSLPFGKYFYLLTLCATIASLFYWSYERVFFMTGIGFLEAETSFVEARNPGRIMQIKCSVNDTVTAGAPLVILGKSAAMNFTAGNSRGAYNNQQPQKVITAESKANVLRQEIAHKKLEIARLRNEVQRARKLLALDALTRPEVIKVEDRLQKAEYDLSILRIQLDTALRLLQSYGLEAGRRGINAITAETGTIPGEEHVLYAPSEGIVSLIYKQRGEIAQVGEPVLKIKDHTRTYIKAYFPASFEGAILPGDDVTVQFEDGQENQGYVREIYPTAFEQPKEMGKRFGKADRYVVAEVVPKKQSFQHRILETKVKVRIAKDWWK